MLTSTAFQPISYFSYRCFFCFFFSVPETCCQHDSDARDICVTRAMLLTIFKSQRSVWWLRVTAGLRSACPHLRPISAAVTHCHSNRCSAASPPLPSLSRSFPPLSHSLKSELLISFFLSFLLPSLSSFLPFFLYFSVCVTHSIPEQQTSPTPKRQRNKKN